MASKKISENDLEIWKSYKNFHAEIIHKIDRELTQRNLVPLAWFDVLLTLEKTPGKRMRMNELSESCILTKSGVTKIINTLQLKKLVIRTRCPKDARGLYAEITEQGKIAVSAAWPIYESCLKRFFLEPLTSTEKDSLHSILLKLRTNQNLSI